MATTKKVVVEDDEEDATIEEEAEDGIGSRDRFASSDTNLMRNGAGSSSSWLERGGSLWRTDCNGGGREV